MTRYNYFFSWHLRDTQGTLITTGNAQKLFNQPITITEVRQYILQEINKEFAQRGLTDKAENHQLHLLAFNIIPY